MIGLIHAQKNTNQFKQEEIFSLEVWNLSAFDKYYVMVTVVSPEQEERELPWSPPLPKTQAHLLNSSAIDHVLQYHFFVFFYVMFQLWAIDGQVWDSNPGKDMLTSVEIWTWWNYKSADCKYLIRRTVLSIWVLLVVGSFGTEPHLETQTKGKLGQERFRLPPLLFLSPCFFLVPDFPRKVEPWSELNAIDVG